MGPLSTHAAAGGTESCKQISKAWVEGSRFGRTLR
jgi:hypothetical protein